MSEMGKKGAQNVDPAAPFKSEPALTFRFFFPKFKFKMFIYLLDADVKSSRGMVWSETCLQKFSTCYTG